jgi:lysyl-tRNA synthetase class 2
MLEAYCAFGDYATMMELVESLIKDVAQKVIGKLQIQRNTNALKTHIQEAIRVLAAPTIPANPNISTTLQALKHLEQEISQRSTVEIAREASALCEKAHPDLLTNVEGGTAGLVVPYSVMDIAKNLANLTSKNSEPIDLSNWRRVKYNDLIKEKCGADWFTISAAERRQKAHDMGAEIGKEFEDFEVTNAVFSKFIEPTLIQPTFVTHLPKELVPLAKLSPDDPTTVEVFECCINGQEISPGYTEQNDS